MARYLVTGGAGFIGSHIVHTLVADGHQARVVDDLSSGKLDNLADISAKVEFLQGDIRDRTLIRKAVPGCDYVLHVAAWRSVPKSMNDPYGYADVNVLATVSILEEAVKAKCKRVVVVSSSSVYGNSDKVPLTEDLPTNPISPYACSKLADEIYCGMFYRGFKLETAAVRYFNVFGPRQSLENQYAVVIPKFITCVLKGEAPPIYGDGTQSRDFTYVDNVVEGTLRAATEPKAAGEVFNIALGEEHSVLDLLSEINKILGKDVKPTFLPPRAGDVKRTLADPSKAQKLLGFEGKIRFAEGLRRTVEWFKAHPAASR
jgi:nucleoside-diphosphate-sugar epimerase